VITEAVAAAPGPHSRVERTIEPKRRHGGLATDFPSNAFAIFMNETVARGDNGFIGSE
jgi:hypothetical protein